MKLDHHRKHIRKKRLATRQDRIMTLANAISISRIFLALPLVWYLEQDKTMIAMVYIVLIVLSDLFDGMVARRADEITNFGKMIDPIADKICMMVVIIYLVFEYGMPFLIFFILLGVRDIILVILTIFNQDRAGQVFQSKWAGKWFIGISAFTMFLYVINLPQYGIYFYFVSLLMMAVSTRDYLKFHMYHLRRLDA